MNINALYVKPVHLQAADQNGESWGVWACRDIDRDNAPFRAVGVMHPNRLTRQSKLTLTGEWKNHPKFGRQFLLKSYLVHRPHTKAGVMNFLVAIPRIGYALAQKIWEAHGERSIDILISDRHQMDDILGEKCKEASEYAANTCRDNERWLAIASFLAKTGIPGTTVEIIAQDTINDPVGLFSANPFALMRYPGCSFARCDALRRRLGLPNDVACRLAAAARHVLGKDVDTFWVRRRKLAVEMGALLDVSPPKVQEIIDSLLSSEAIFQRRDCISLAGPAAVEARLYGEGLLNRDSEMHPWPDPDTLEGLTAHQAQEVRKAFRNGCTAFLMGLAGTGKTVAAASIVKAMPRGTRTFACAPTNKAANRLTLAMKSAGANLRATSIHSMLGAQPRRGKWEFEPTMLDADLMVVDEASMLTNELFLRVMDSIPGDCLVLVLGDHGQLPAIGHGALLRDWIKHCDRTDANTYGHLTEQMRSQAKDHHIIEAFARGQYPDIPRWEWHEAWSPGTYLEPCQNDLSIQHVLEDYILEIRDHSCMDPIRDFQVVTATNKNSPVSRADLNPFIQKLVNPYMEGDHPLYKVGDRVICLETRELCASHEVGDVKIANGEMGYVAESHERLIRVHMESHPDTLLTVPCSSGRGGFDLGYAVTCHKMQGSQCPVVFVALGSDYATRSVTNREWLYTAITRKESVGIIGARPETLRATVIRTGIKSRVTFAEDLLYDKEVAHYTSKPLYGRH